MVRWEAACPGCCVLKAEQSFQWSTTNSSSSPSSGLTGPVALTKVSLSLMSIMPELVPASPCMSPWETMSTRVRSSHTCCMWAAPSHVHHPLRLPGKQPLSAPASKGSFSSVVMGMLSLRWKEGYWSGSTPGLESPLDVGSAWKHPVSAAVGVIFKSGWWIQLAIKRLIFTLIAD